MTKFTILQTAGSQLKPKDGIHRVKDGMMTSPNWKIESETNTKDGPK
jgi:hypothetical protein